MKNKEKKKKERGFLSADFWFFRRVFKYCPSYIITCVIYGVIMGIWPALGILYTERLYDDIGRGVLFEKILLLIGVYFGAMLIIRILHTIYQLILLPQFRETLNLKVYSDIFEHSRKTDLANYDNPDFFNDFVMSTQAAFTHGTQLIEGTGWLIRDTVAITVSAGVVYTIDPLVALLIVISGIARMVIHRSTNKIWLKYEETINPIRRKSEYTKRMFHMPDYAKDIRISKVDGCLVDKYGEAMDEYKDTTLKFNRKFFRNDCIFFVFLDIAQYAVMIILLYKLMVVGDSAAGGGITLGGFAVGVNAIWSMSWRIESFASKLTAFHKHGVFINKLIAFFETKPKIVDGGIDAPTLESITLKNLDFSYTENDEKFSLKSIDMEIKRGEKIAIVGYNGAGKTTLTKLLMRLYDPTAGEILYNGRALSEYNIDSLRNRVAAVFQDYKIFAATVAENVVGGQMPEDREERERARERVIEALEKSTFSDKLEKLPQGIDTPLTREFADDGTCLSGGESQKVAIARAFYKDADLIILDEPSSALDPNAEYELNRAIAKYAEDKTVIFISHRLSTTCHADRIYMFDNGKIVECGSHNELMKMGGKYAYMFNLQAEKYRDN